MFIYSSDQNKINNINTIKIITRDEFVKGIANSLDLKIKYSVMKTIESNKKIENFYMY